MKKQIPMPFMKSRLLKTLVVMVVLSAVLAVSVPTAISADIYPNKPVRLIIPWAPGGSSDIVGRYIATKLSERLGKQVVIDNRPGATGAIGTEAVAKAPPDGYTLLFPQEAFTVIPALQKDLPFDAIKSFAPVARIGSVPSVLIVQPSSPINSVREFIALAKQKPGQLIFAGAGYGGASHLQIEFFKMTAGIDFKIVQFKGGGGPAVIDLMGGHSDATILPIPTVLPHIKSGKLKALAATGLKRSVILPDIPTFSESGVNGFEKVMWWGILAPAGTPVPIIDKLTMEIKAVLASNESTKFFLNQGAEGTYMSPTEFSIFLEESITQWSGVVKAANIKLEEQK